MSDKKTHVNVGTIGHVDYGRSGRKVLLSAAIASVLASTSHTTPVICNGHIVNEGYPKPRVNKKNRHKVK